MATRQESLSYTDQLSSRPEPHRLVFHDGIFDSTQGTIIDGTFGLQPRFVEGKTTLAILAARSISVELERKQSDPNNTPILDAQVVSPVEDIDSDVVIFDPETHSSATIEGRYRITLASSTKSGPLNIAEYHLDKSGSVSVNNVYNDQDFKTKLIGGPSSPLLS